MTTPRREFVGLESLYYGDTHHYLAISFTLTLATAVDTPHRLADRQIVYSDTQSGTKGYRDQFTPLFSRVVRSRAIVVA